MERKTIVEVSGVRNRGGSLEVDVYVRFGGSDPETAELARAALQPVLDSIYRSCRGEPYSEIEEVLRRAGRGAFARDNIEMFARYITYGDRPVLTD